MKCPTCKLINPDTALRCDCGYDFQSGRMGRPYLSAKTPTVKDISRDSAGFFMNDMSEDVKALREIAEHKQKAEATAGIVTLLLFALVIGWCVHADNAVEAEKKWCRGASAKEFVDQFETRCVQYRYDPAIKARIERIMSGKEK